MRGNITLQLNLMKSRQKAVVLHFRFATHASHKLMSTNDCRNRVETSKRLAAMNSRLGPFWVPLQSPFYTDTKRKKPYETVKARTVEQVSS